MTELLELGTAASSPLTHRVIQSRFASVDDAVGDSIKIYHGGCSKRMAGGALLALVVLFFAGYNLLHVHSMRGAGLMLIGATGIAYVVYELRRNKRVFILDDSFAMERRFRSEVELIKWTDVTKLYCLDRTTTTRFYVLGFIPVGSSNYHQGRLTIVLVDGRRLVITNRVRNFSDLANQFIFRTTAVQLKPCAQYVLQEGGTLDFDKFGLASNGLVHKGKLINWDDIQGVSLNQRNVLSFRTPSRWRRPRFSLETIPNASLLFELLSMLGVQWLQES